MTSKERLQSVLDHKQADKIVIDFGSTPTTGIHVLAVENLRRYYGLEKKPVKVTEPFQMLGELEEDLQEVLGVDVIGLSPRNNMFGFTNEDWKEFKTFWGQTVLVPAKFNTSYDRDGSVLIYPEGNTEVPPSGRMPKLSYFFDAIIRQQPIDDNALEPNDNLQEFGHISAEDLAYWDQKVTKALKTGKGIVANFGGTAIGDIGLVPGTGLVNSKGIRDVAEWYMSILMRRDYVMEVFDKQTDIAVSNLKKIFNVVGNAVDTVFICGNDFGTQNSQFCSRDDFEEVYAPYYRKMNDWIHANTKWKTFKHSCGAVEPLIENFIMAGFDILNPVQINAVGMDSRLLKQKYGDRLVFWGGGVDTQKVLAFGTPDDVKKQVKEQCKVLGEKGGFVFNTVHNVQANVPVENLAAMIDTLKNINNS
ncbi:MAG: methyltransferase, partial [Bacteroidales bacterium]|nr:methyltransferase [Bacteroidales bacterium]